MTIKSVQRRHEENRYSKSALIADWLGLTHFFLANVAFILGEFTELFSFIDVSHAGYVLINFYIDAPIYNVLKPYVGDVHSDWLMMLLSVELVIVVASVVYALLTYAFCKLLSFISV